MNRKWDLTSTKKNQIYDSESADTPSLLNIKRLDSKSNNENHPQLPKVSSKPPLNKKAYKISQKPTIQGWLYKQKTPSLSLSSSNSNLSNSLSNLTNSNLRNQLTRPKWKRYWCVLVKDYIAFYKNQEEKTPKDFLLLKDFNVSKSDTIKYGFLISDKLKQLEHEFYAETREEFKDWCQCLNDLRSKLNSEQLSLSSTSLSSASGFDADSTLNLYSQSLSSTSSLNRKNNLQLNLSTIIDSTTDDISSSLNSSSINAQAFSSSPTLISNLQQSFNNSSRESSPGLSTKHSRDSSPSLTYRKFIFIFRTCLPFKIF